MIEVKADGMEERFDAILQEERVAALEADIAALKGQVAGAFLAGRRPALDGVKAADGAAVTDPARATFVERYLRRGLEAGVELKSLSGATDGAGGYAVPREIDAMIETQLKAASPTRPVVAPSMQKRARPLQRFWARFGPMVLFPVEQGVDFMS